jgi:hypothetical protein
MLLADFSKMNHRCEKAIALTRRARRLDRHSAQRVGEAAAKVLRDVVIEMWESRRQYSQSH